MQKPTLSQMKRAILDDTSHLRQRGAQDYTGYLSDSELRRQVKQARTWGELLDAAPPSWGSRVIGRTFHL